MSAARRALNRDTAGGAFAIWRGGDYLLPTSLKDLPMPVEKWSDSIVVAHLADDPQFTEDMEAAERLSPPCHSGVLDFSAVHVVNSSNIARLLSLRRHIGALNGKLILCNLGTEVWGALLMTGLDKIFEFSENVPTALATIQMKE